MTLEVMIHADPAGWIYNLYVPPGTVAGTWKEMVVPSPLDRPVIVYCGEVAEVALSPTLSPVSEKFVPVIKKFGEDGFGTTDVIVTIDTILVYGP
jgi:hypothetical protein